MQGMHSGRVLVLYLHLVATFHSHTCVHCGLGAVQLVLVYFVNLESVEYHRKY